MPVVLGLLGALLFGANGSLTKVVIEAGLSPVQVTQFRTLGSAVLAGIVLLIIDRSAFRISWRQLISMAVLGIFGIALLQATYAEAITLLPVGIALLLEYLAVLAVAVIARIVFKERVKGRVWVAIVLVLAGLAVVAKVWDSPLDAIGVVWGLAAAAFLTFYFIFGERQINATSPLAVLFWASLFAAIFWAFLSGWWELSPETFGQTVSLGGALEQVNLPLWLPLASVIALGSFLPFLLSFFALSKLKATTAGILASSEIIFAFAVAWLWLGEALDIVQILGAAIVLVGIVLAQTARPGKVADPDLALMTGPIPTTR